jgi:class 3 adenylate cyclase
MASTSNRTRDAGDEPLVGRAAECAAIERWLDLAAEGAPSIGFVRGSPGVGKSRLQRAAADQALGRGFRVLRGTGFDGTPSLLPVLTALAPLIRQAQHGRRSDLTAEDVDALATLVPTSASADRAAIGQRAGDDAHRYLAATRLLLGASRARPILLAIDEAHALDEASASLLAHLVAVAAHESETNPVPLLTLLCLRPGAGSPPVRRTLERMRDEPGSAELVLDGLDEVGLNELLMSFGPATPSRPLLRLIRARTGGNPLYARLMWSHLLDTGAAAEQGSRVVLVDPSDAHATQLGLDDVIDTRLDALDEECRGLLAVASVLGAQGDVGTLAEAADQPLERVEDLLLQGEEAGVCRVEGPRYRFDHPLLVAAVTRAIRPRERGLLHVRLADTLAHRAAPPALEIASHLRDAGALAPLDARRRWGAEAAARAMELGAWADAVAAFTLALDDGVSDELPAERRLSLWAGAVRASAADHDLDSCERFARTAIDLARELGDLDTWCDVIADLGHARVRVVRGGEAMRVADLEELLAVVGEEQFRLRARVTALLAEACFAAFDFERGLAFAEEASHLADEAGDDEVLAFALFVLGLQHQGRFELDESERCFHKSVEYAHGDFAGGTWSRGRLPSAQWLRGDLRAAAASARLAEAGAADSTDWAELSLVTAWRANVEGAAGRFGEAERTAERALVLQRRCDYAFTSIVAQPVLAIARSMRGNLDGARRGLAGWRELRPSRWIDQLEVLVSALAGDDDAVRLALQQTPWRVIHDEEVDLRRAASLCAQVEIGSVVGDAAMVTAARTPLHHLHERGVRFVPGSLSLVARLAAVAASFDGDGSAAAGWLEVARDDARRAGAAGELARCDLDEVDAARREGADHPDRDHLLGSAAAAFDRLGMLPFLRRTEQVLDATGAAHVHRTRKVVLFTDLVGSTSLNAASGDERYLQLVRAHDRAVRSSLHRHDGVEFKHTGDGLAAWFASPRMGVRCALDLQDTLAGALRAESGLEVRIRCGLAAGEPIEDRGDLFGLTVARAKRICDLADGGGVLVSAEIPPMIRDDSIAFHDQGAVSLRGIPEPTHLHTAHAVTGRR